MLPSHVVECAGLGTESAGGRVGGGVDGVEKGAVWVGMCQFQGGSRRWRLPWSTCRVAVAERSVHGGSVAVFCILLHV